MRRTFARIAVCVDENGNWYAVGSGREDGGRDDNNARFAAEGGIPLTGCERHLIWFEALLPCPAPKEMEQPTVEGEVAD